MAAKKYTIVKYKGKTKIKNTKTGESVDIDIEKFMNGGYKTLSDSYEYGGQKSVQKFDCGGQFTVGTPEYNDCMDKERRATLFDDAGEIDYNTDPNTGEPLNPNNNITQQNQGIVTESTYRGPTDEELDEAELDDDIADLQEFNSDPRLNREARRGKKMKEEEDTAFGRHMYKTLDKDGYFDENSSTQDYIDNYNMPNPYAGVDIPTAANHLGSSIENKSAIGMAASSLKILAGLGRNVVTGLGNQKRYNRVMKDYYTKQKNNRNPVQYLEYGGKKDEELATGEYMHGVENENIEDYNAEIEKGEYFQSNEGDIAEVVGDKHSQGGEKIQMEAEDRVLSDKLKLGNKTAKMLASKYDLKLKAKNTYADVLDKFRKKMKLDTLLEEEADILKKIGEQSKVEDATTKGFNLQVLTQKQEEIKKQKHPIEEQRKDVFEELFNIQESTKPKKKVKEDNTFEYGGKLESLAKEYNIPMDRAKQLVEEFSKGGKKKVPKYDLGGDIKKLYEFYSSFQDVGDIKEFEENFKSGSIYIPKRIYNTVVGGGKRAIELKDDILSGELELQDLMDSGITSTYERQLLLDGEQEFEGLNFNNKDQYLKAAEIYQKAYKNRTGRDFKLPKLPPNSVEDVNTEVGMNDLDKKLDRISSQSISIAPATKDNEESLRLLNMTAASTPILNYSFKGNKEGKININNFLRESEENQKKIAQEYGIDLKDLLEKAKDPIARDFVFTSDQAEDVKTVTEDKTNIPSNTETEQSTTKSEVDTPQQEEEVIDYVPEGRENAGMFPYLFPDESPLPPTALQGTVKIQPRYDRVRPSEIDVEPYLQDIQDREQAQVQSLEGLSPNVRAAVLANMRANSNKQESDVRNKIDTANIGSQEKAIYTNAQIQQREENSNNRERLMYEMRQYKAQANTDNDVRNYINAKQDLNATRFTDIHNMNLINANNESTYFDGQTFRRKQGQTDQELMSKFAKMYESEDFKNYLKTLENKK